jgi:hypothetical protein
MANNQLKQQKVEKNNPVVWIADWNGSNKGLGTVKNQYLSAAVIRLASIVKSLPYHSMIQIT